MGTFAFIIGSILIFCGMVLKKYPNIMKGYRTLSPEKRKEIDIPHVITFLQECLIATGLAIILWYYVLGYMGLHLLASYYIVIPMVIIPFTILKVRNYNHSPYTWGDILTIGAITLLMAIMTIAAVFSMRSPGVTIENDKLLISGKFSISRPLSSIESISLSDTIPDIAYSPKGISIGSVHKGWFRSESGMSFQMYVVSARKPYIVVTDKSGGHIYINMSTPEKTMHTFNELMRNGHFVPPPAPAELSMELNPGDTQE